VESNKRIIELLNTEYGLNKTEDDMDAYDYKSIAPISHDEVLALYESDEFFNNLEFKKGALDTILKYKNQYHIIIATRGTQTNLAKKHQWIKQNISNDLDFIGIDGEYIQKSFLNMHDGIQIDDETLCLHTNAGLKILYTSGHSFPWQKINPNDDIIVVHSWKELDEILNFYSKYDYKTLLENN
jgi:5'(3')-deoxyribonucleotidase